MLPGTRARSFAPGFVNTTSRLSRRALACVSCPSCCRRKVPGSIPLSPNGSTASATWSRPMACLPPNSWPSGSVLTMELLMSLISSFPKRLRESALGPANEVLVSDFGIAMIAPTSRSQSVLEMAGTVSYMAPEQIRGKPRFASDQYALAVIIFEWLSGERPFTGAPMEIATQHVLAPAPLLRDKVPGLASEVEQVILTALAKDPKDRFTHIQAFATALEQAYKEQIQRQQQQARPIVPVVSPLPLSVEKPLPSPVLEKSLPASESPIIASKPSPLPPITQANSVSPSIYIPVPSVSPQSVTPAIPGPPPLPVTTTNEPARSALGNNVKLRRSRLFYPTRILFVLLIVALVGGGSYFSIRSHNDAVNVDTSLRTASGLIDQARAAVAQDPATALSRLASARTNLLAVQNTSLSETQHAQFRSE